MLNNHEVYANYSWSSIDNGGMTMLHRPFFTPCQMIMLCEWLIYMFTPKHPQCKQISYRWSVRKGGSVHCYMLKSSRFRCRTRENTVSNQPFVRVMLPLWKWIQPSKVLGSLLLHVMESYSIIQWGLGVRVHGNKQVWPARKWNRQVAIELLF